MITLSDETHITPTLTFNGNAYFRSYAQAHVDGNISDFFHCAAGGGLLCNGDDATISSTADQTRRSPTASRWAKSTATGTRTLSTGATGQLTDTDRILGHNNTITAGVSVDHGWSHFVGNSELGTLPPNFVVQGYGQFINEPDFDVSPSDIRTQNTYVGVYVLDNFDITDRLSIHAGARFNDAIISLADQTGQNPDLNSSSNFNRINPVVGATFKITPDISVYASYSEANRAPTPLELGCASPDNPCMIDNFLVADPPLKQIVARTVEAGFKGSNAIAWSWAPGRLDWSIAGYRTENQNDIYSVSERRHGLRLLHQCWRYVARRCRHRGHLYDRPLGRLRQLFLHPGDVPDADKSFIAEQPYRRHRHRRD